MSTNILQAFRFCFNCLDSRLAGEAPPVRIGDVWVESDILTVLEKRSLFWTVVYKDIVAWNDGVDVNEFQDVHRHSALKRQWSSRRNSGEETLLDILLRLDKKEDLESLGLTTSDGPFYFRVSDSDVFLAEMEKWLCEILRCSSSIKTLLPKFKKSTFERISRLVSWLIGKSKKLPKVWLPKDQFREIAIGLAEDSDFIEPNDFEIDWVYQADDNVSYWWRFAHILSASYEQINRESSNEEAIQNIQEAEFWIEAKKMSRELIPYTDNGVLSSPDNSSNSYYQGLAEGRLEAIEILKKVLFFKLETEKPDSRTVDCHAKLLPAEGVDNLSIPNEAKLKRLKKPELVELAQSHDLDTTGTRSDIIARLEGISKPK